MQYDQKLIRVHHVLIGKMSPDIQGKKKENDNVWHGSGLIDGFFEIKSEHNKPKRSLAIL